MKTNLLPPLAVAFGLSFCALAHGQTQSYQAPAKWSQFNAHTSPVFRPASTTLYFDDAAQAAAEKATDVAAQAAKEAAKQDQIEELPIPAFVPAERPLLDENGGSASSCSCTCCFRTSTLGRAVCGAGRGGHLAVVRWRGIVVPECR